MVLNRRYRRNIRSNLPFYIAATVLTAVSLLLFILFYIAGTGINDFGDRFFASQHLEDATFTTYLPIDEATMAQMEQDYDVILEAEDYINFKEGDTTVRIFRPTTKIDLYQVIDGQDISSDDEILLSAGYCQNMGISIGDTFPLQGKEYTVCGTFLRPDYCSALVETTDSYKNITTFVFGYVSEAVFDSFENTAQTYKVIYKDTSRQLDFRKAVNNDFVMRTYVSTDDNPRITYVHEQADMFLIMAWVLLVIVPLVTVSLIGMILGRKVEMEQKIIGTLLSMGYTKGKLTRHYMLLAILPGLFGGILTAASGVILAQPYGQLCLADYEPLTATFRLPISIAALGIVIPTAIYGIKACLTVRKLLKKNTTELLSGRAGRKTHLSKFLYRRNTAVYRKFSVRSLIGNPGRSFVVLLGIFLGAYIVALSFTFVDSIQVIGEQSADNLGDFQYEYVLKTLKQGSSENGEPMLGLSGEMDGKSFSILGTDSDVSLWNTNLTDGEKAELTGKWYMSNLLATVYGTKPGDTITFRNKTSMQEYTVKISGIIANDYIKYIITDRETLGTLVGIDEESYNIVLSDTETDIPSEELAETVEAASIYDQVDAMLSEMNVIIYSLTVIGIIICVAALYVSIHMMVAENRTNISMLRVLGFRNREINRMVLSANHALLPIGIVLGIYLSVRTMDVVSILFAEMASMILPPYITLFHIVLTVVLVCGCYFGSLVLVKHKANVVDMVESLKDNRE